VYKEYVDVGISGAKPVRPALNALISDSKKRLFDAVLVWRFDRFFRSVSHLLSTVSQFRHLGIDFLSWSENVDTSSPMGEMIMTVLGSVAQLERNLLTERIAAGLRRALKEGKQLGRPQVACDICQVQRMRAEGCSLRDIADFTHVSKSKIASMLDVHKSLSPALIMESGLCATKAE
jgi:DNA invertase Pin-like site-specific DNA recombinase